MSEIIMKFFVITVICLTLTACSKYNVVDFCWSSDDHLKPSERFVALKAGPDEVADAVRKWIHLSGGEEVIFNTNFNKVIRKAENADDNFIKASEIAKKRWESYSTNNPYDWTRDKETYQQLSISQKEEITSNNGGYRIEAKMLRGKVEAKKITVDVYKTFASKKSELTGYAHTNVLTYDTTGRKLASKMTFWIFADGEGTRVYAQGRPFDEIRNLDAGVGAEIPYKWWPYVTGENEAWLVVSALQFLKNLYS